MYCTAVEVCLEKLIIMLNLGSVQRVGAYHCHHGISFATLSLSNLHPVGL